MWAAGVWPFAGRGERAGEEGGAIGQFAGSVKVLRQPLGLLAVARCQPPAAQRAAHEAPYRMFGFSVSNEDQSHTSTFA